MTEAVVRRCSVKKVLFKISHNSLENICIKELQAETPI